MMVRRGIGLGAALLIAACGHADNTGPASIAIATAASTVSVAPGASATVAVTLRRTNFTDGVTLAADGLPAGVTASFAPATLGGGTTQSTLTLAAAPSAAPGAATITVRATGAGVAAATAAIALTVPQAPAYTLALTPAALSIASGATGTVNVALTRANFTDAVTFAASGVPTGATVTFAPSPTTSGATVMTVNAGTAAPGTYNVTVTGSATGLADRTATLALTISAPSSYTLTPAASTVAISAGASATVNVGLARSNFTGDISLALSGLPAGATATFAPNPASGTSSVLTINAGTAAAGSYPLTITGTAPGLADRTAPLTLNVTAVTGTNVQFTFCAEALPVWVGYQDGTGPWKQAIIGPNNTYSFSISGTGGVAIVRPTESSSSAAGYTTDIFFASASELQTYGATTCTAPQLGTTTVHGSVAGTGGGVSSVALFNARANVVGDGAFTLDSLKGGSHDLLATLLSSTTYSATKMIIRRGIAPASGSTLPVLDFASSEAFALAPSTLVLPGVAATTQVLAASSFTTANGSTTSLGFSSGPASAATYTGVPTAHTTASDLQELLVEATETNGVRGAIAYFTGTGTQTLTLGAALNAPTVTSLGVTPYPRLRAQYASQADYSAVAMVTYEQGGSTPASTDRTVNVWATPSWFGGVPATWDISIPDLSAATGFQGTWMLAAGTPTTVTTSGYGGNVLTATPAAGTTFYFAQNQSSITTPTGVSGARLQRSASSVRSTRRLAARSAPILQALRNRRLRRHR